MFLAPRPLPSCPEGEVFFRVLHPFFNQFFDGALFVGRWDGRGFGAVGNGDRLPAAIFWEFFCLGQRRVQAFAAGQFVTRLADVGIKHLMLRAPVDNGQLARALKDHFFGDGPNAVGILAETSLVNLVFFHAMKWLWISRSYISQSKRRESGAME